MATVVCNFVIQAMRTPNGGRLAGAGFGPRTPQLGSRDSLQIVVTWAGPNPPQQLNGYIIIAPAQDAPPNQTAASPFVIGTSTNPLCFLSVSVSPKNSKFEWPVLTVPRDAPEGKFELTFVAENPATDPPSQWSEDPEFDTGG
jgi:hypothetical protein